MKVRAACLEGIKKIHLVEKDISLKEDEVLVKTHQASICLADIQRYLKGYYVPWEPSKFPIFPGHEGGGTIEEVGARVHEYKVGDKVILMHDARTVGSGMGSMSNYFKTRPKDLIPAPDDLDMDIACLGETICPFVFVVLRSGIKLGDTVVVTGLGFIGQIIAQGIKKSGASEVIVIDTSDYRLDLAKQLGADVIINSKKQDAIKTVLELTNREGADLVCQTAAYTDPTVEEYMNLAVEVVKPTGILAFQGDFLHPITIKNIHRWHCEALDIRCIAFRHNNWQEVHVWAKDCLKPIQKNMIEIKPLITSIYHLDDISEAFKEATENPNALKILIKP